MLSNEWIRRGLILLFAYAFYLWSWHTAFATENLYQFNPSPPAASAVPHVTGLAISPQVLMSQLQQHIVYNQSGPNSIGHILIDDRTSGINQATWLYVKGALDYYKTSKPIFIILELNTPGGEVFASQLISDGLKEIDIQYNIPVVAYINNWAISAGAMLAYSCRFIAVAKDASMGAAEPVMQDATSGKMESASEKVNSAIRTDFANRARFFDRNPLLAEAMVDKDLILVLRDGQITKLDQESQLRSQDILISPKGKLLTLNASQLIDYGVADMLVPPTKTTSLTPEERSSAKWPAEKFALFHQPFFNAIPQATIDVYQMDWKMRFFAFLASPIVSSLLFLGLMVGAYLEFTTPGFGLAGTVAVTCLFLIILSSLSLEIANWLEVILLFAGLAVILIELFVLPTFGLLGFIGIIFFLMGLFGMMLPGLDSITFDFDSKTFNAAGQAFFERLAWLSGTIVLAFLIILTLARYVAPHIVTWNRLVLKGNEQNGFLAVDGPLTMPKAGAIGEVASPLRPAGKVFIDDVLYDAISTGAFIERGLSITVVGMEGGALLVEETKVV